MPLPFKSAYRGLPELYFFSDEECERYCLRVFQREKLRYVAPAAFTLLLVPVSILFALGLNFAYHGLLSRGFVYTIVILAAAAAVWFSVRVRNLAIRQALKEHLTNPECPGCRFSLRGLPIADGRVRCPECGEVCILIEHLYTTDSVRVDSPREGHA